MEYVFLVSGLVLLLLSGHFLVKGGVSLARHFKISTLVVGVTVVSFGTSAPELFVSLQSALGGNPNIALGNVIGSNISNVALVLALAAVILPLAVNKNSLLIDWPVMMGVSLLLFLFLYLNRDINRFEGIVFVVLLVAYNYFSIWNSRRQMKKSHEEIPEPEYHLAISLLIVMGACIGLVIGSIFLVDKGAVVIAEKAGISERVIAISMIAVGTSLPEMATSIVAAIKKQMDISVGNIIGSNIFNILAVFGITSVVKPIENADPNILSFDLYWMIGISLILFLLCLPLKKARLNRIWGVFFLLVYAAYILLLFKMNTPIV